MTRDGFGGWPGSFPYNYRQVFPVELCRHLSIQCGEMEWKREPSKNIYGDQWPQIRSKNIGPLRHVSRPDLRIGRGDSPDFM